MGAKLGEVLESQLFMYPRKVTIIKVKVLLDATKYLKPSMHIGNVKDGTS